MIERSNYKQYANHTGIVPTQEKVDRLCSIDSEAKFSAFLSDRKASNFMQDDKRNQDSSMKSINGNSVSNEGNLTVNVLESLSVTQDLTRNNRISKSIEPLRWVQMKK